MHTLRFGRKLNLPSTIAIKLQVRMLMAQYEPKKAEAEARPEVFRGQPSLAVPCVTPATEINAKHSLWSPSVVRSFLCWLRTPRAFYNSSIPCLRIYLVGSRHHLHNVRCGIENILSLLEHNNEIVEKADQLSRRARDYITYRDLATLKISDGTIGEDVDRLRIVREALAGFGAAVERGQPNSRGRMLASLKSPSTSAPFTAAGSHRADHVFGTAGLTAPKF